MEEKPKAGQREKGQDIRELRKTGGELILGSMLTGLFLQAFLLFFPSKAANAAGLWIGVGMASFYAIHMCLSLEKAVLEEPGKAERMIRSRYLARYVCSGLALTAILYIGKGKISVWTLLAGLGTLKAAACFQPKLHQILLPGMRQKIR